MWWCVILLLNDQPALIQGVSGSSNGALEVKAGAVVVRAGEPGGAFATLRVGKGKSTLPFFAVLRHGMAAGGVSESSESVSLEDRRSSLKHTLTLDGKTVVVIHSVELSADGTKIARESLVINGKPTDLAKGRVLLIDMTGESVRWEQKKIALPGEVSDVTGSREAADLVQRVIADLVKQDGGVKSFLEGK